MPSRESKQLYVFNEHQHGPRSVGQHELTLSQEHSQMNIGRRQSCWNSSLLARPSFSRPSQKSFQDREDEVNHDTDCYQQSAGPELLLSGVEPYTVREAVRATGLSRYRLYKMIHAFEVAAHMDPFGPRLADSGPRGPTADVDRPE